jgi:hypothetical protein
VAGRVARALTWLLVPSIRILILYNSSYPLYTIPSSLVRVAHRSFGWWRRCDVAVGCGSVASGLGVGSLAGDLPPSIGCLRCWGVFLLMWDMGGSERCRLAGWWTLVVGGRTLIPPHRPWIGPAEGNGRVR